MELFDLDGYGWLLWKGVRLTLLVGFGAMCVAIFFGLISSWGKLSRSRLALGLANTYTTVVRGVPELVMILLVYYGFPTLVQDISTSLGYSVTVNLDPFTAGIVTLGFIYGAFSTEVFRGALLAVPKGQIEAAQAVGMGKILAFRRIIFPQMWRFALPGIGNVWMVLIKATSLISIIQLPELMRNADIASRATQKPFTFFVIASFFYLGITIISNLVQKKAENWADRGVRRI
jgi:His/Glu/Gln/Arg/opine family amino acid ABC transporter permease subunit